MIRIAQASSSENGTATGTPPNQLRTKGQLDGELNVIPFYASNWQAVYRAKDERIAEKIAVLAYKTVQNGSHVGYGQQLTGYARTGLYDALYQMTVPDPDAITGLVNCDCSSFVGACCYFAGAYEPRFRNMNTSTETGYLMNSGYFVMLADEDLLKTARGVKRGDIFWRPGHTVIAIDSDGEQETEPRRIWNCKACNMRSGGSTAYPIVGVLHPGDIVYLISTASTGWGQVRTDNGVGFVSPKFLTLLKQGTATGNVWLREDAGTANKALIVIANGSKVWLTGETKRVGLTTWYGCIYSGKRGFASGKYLKTS